MPGIRRRLFLVSILVLAGKATASAAAESETKSAKTAVETAAEAAGTTKARLKRPEKKADYYARGKESRWPQVELGGGAVTVGGGGAAGNDGLPRHFPPSIEKDAAAAFGSEGQIGRESPSPSSSCGSDDCDDNNVDGGGDDYDKHVHEVHLFQSSSVLSSSSSSETQRQRERKVGDGESFALLLQLLPENRIWESWLEKSGGTGTGLSIGRRLEDSSSYHSGSSETEANRMCSEYLVSFLEGTTDAKDTCEGIMNAYYAADCASTLTSSTSKYDGEDEDDYFGEFYEHMCCASLQSHHSQYCEESKLITNMHLLLVVSVLVLCECAKSVVKKNDINFLPEAAVCILVGAFCGFVAHVTPGSGIDEMSFDDDLFLSVLLPPIIFEAAISVSKPQFRRRRGAIFMLAVVGTVLSSFMTGLMVHFMSKASGATTIPMLDSLIFGSLISSIDPVAILSVLSSLHLNQKDMIFILVFGESLLNDGVAITLFQSLVERGAWGPNGGITMSYDELFGAIADFLIVGFGSTGVGLACGVLALIYFWMFQNVLHPVMEVGSFFLWALIPYYISDGVDWSGIVAIVCMGFFMDMYIASPADATPEPSPKANINRLPGMLVGGDNDLVHTYNHADLNRYSIFDFDDQNSPSANLCDEPCGRGRSLLSMNLGKLLSGKERVRLSQEADKHVRFVAHLTSALSENAIFAYLGLFLYSNTYVWDPTLVMISIASCVLSRALMVIIVCWLFYHVHDMRAKWVQKQAWKRAKRAGRPVEDAPVIRMSRTAEKLQDKKMQVVLVLAGLRGAVSLALMENVPIYNAVTGEGCEFKPLLKAMTSASILFTTFVFGGGAYYILPHLGIHPHHEGEGDRSPDDDNLPSTSDISSIAPPASSPRRKYVEMSTWRWTMCHLEDYLCVNDPDPLNMAGSPTGYQVPVVNEAIHDSGKHEDARQMPSLVT